MDAPLGILGRPVGQILFLGRRQKAALSLQNSQFGRPAGKVCEDRIPKTKAMVMFSDEGMTVPLCSGCFEISST